MAIARDQTGTGTVSGSASSVTVTWATAPAAGSKVLLAVYGSIAVSSVRDNGSTQTTFTDDIDNAGVAGWAYIYRGDAVHLPSSGSYAVTVTWSGTASEILAAGRSYTGAAAGAPAAASSSSGTSSSPSSGSATPVTANSLVFGHFVDASGSSETITLSTSGASSIYASTAGTVINGAAADNIAAGTSAQSLSWSLSDSPGWGGLVAVYSPAAGTTVTGVTGRASAAAPAGAVSKTYYVSTSGSDSASGLSPGTPWATVSKVNAATLNPGDSVLFSGGQTWSGTMLYLTSPGTAALPVTIGSYGTGNAVISNGSGEAVYVYNAGGYLIENLSITGISGSAGYSGIEFYCSGSGRLPPVAVENCEIAGWQYGILIGAASAGDGYSGITLTGNGTSSNVYAGVLTYGPAFSAASPAYAHQNVTVSGCTANSNLGSASVTTQWTGSGIVLGSVNGGLVTGCTAHGNGLDNGDASAGPVGIWTYASTGVVISGNLSYGNGSGTAADGDGFDIDVDCTGCRAEYNISYGNAGAGILSWGGTSDSYWGSTSPNVIRWNMCWGNGTGSGGYGELTLGGNLAGLQAYGNTLVSRTSGSVQPSPVRVLPGASLASVTIRNSILYAGSTGAVLSSGTAYAASALLAQGNLYYSTGTFAVTWGSSYSSLAAWRAGASGQEEVSGLAAGLQADPLLAAPGASPSVTSPSSLAPANGLMLTPSSPAAGAGLNLQSLFGVNPGTRDFFGDTLAGSLPVGAAEPGTGVAGVTGAAAVTAPAGSVGTSASVTGVTASAGTRAPAGSIQTAGGATGVTGRVSAAAPAGSVQLSASLTGVTGRVSAASPAGTVQRSALVTGVTARAGATAPAGTVTEGSPATVTGVTGQVSAVAPAGSVHRAASVTGTAAAVSAAAPAGTVAVSAAGASAAAVTAPAGSARVTLSGAAGRAAVTAPAGSVLTGSSDTVTGVAGQVSASAPAGSVQRSALVAGVTAQAGARAAAGSASVTLTGAAASAGARSPAGPAGVALSGAGRAAVTAPAGQVSTGSSASVTGVTARAAVTAPAGTAVVPDVVSGAPGRVSVAAPGGTVSTSASVAGAAGRITAAAPAGSVQRAAFVTGATAAASVTAPAGSVARSAAVTGVAAAAAARAPAGSVQTTAGVAGVTGRVAVTAPAGTVATSDTVTGAAAQASVTAPAGSVHTSASVPGGLTHVTAIAPPGSVRTAAAVAGTAAGVSASAPAGSVHTAASVPGQAGTVTVTAPAGTLRLGVNVIGITAALAVSAQSGQVHYGWTLLGATAQASAAAPAGTVSTVNPPGFVTIRPAGPLAARVTIASQGA